MKFNKETLLADLPYLRRYARALTGSQKSGDQFIRQLLEAVGNDPAGLIESGHPRRDLYQAFHKLFAAFETLETPDPATAGPMNLLDPMVERLAQLSPGRRELLLLTSVEGFSARDAGTIVGLGEAAAQLNIDAARASMVAQRPTTVLIIEDEPVIALNLTDIVRRAGHTVVGVANTKDEAVALAQETRPGLVLCDIQLRDRSSGLDAAREILETMSAPVIFITAFPERLLTGSSHEPAFLVTKPFTADTVLVTISQALLTPL
jgi:CheY-like chemotaxis protein/DNA-directed RNA polymerase specialized sigma24 family protein